MRRYIIFLCLIILFANCSKYESDNTIIFNRVAECLEQYPDSALNMLNKFHLDNLFSTKERARFALLKSMALDKNYIDVDNDSLISVALDYYKKYGKPDELMKAYYYEGIVCLNGEDYSGALENCLSAEKFVADCKDYISVGRLYNTKMIIYKEILSIDKAIKPAELAAYYYLKGQDTIRYITALNNLASMFFVSKDYESFDACITKLEDYEKIMTLKQKGNYYVNLINYYCSISDFKVSEVIDNYINSFKGFESSVKWHIIIKAYLDIGDLQSAYKALLIAEKFELQSNRDIYHLRASEVYSAIGNYERAYENLKIYQETSNGKDYKILKSDVKFLEEKYLLQIKQLKQQNFIIMLGFGIILLLTILILLYRHFRFLNKKRMDRISEIEEQKLLLSNQYEKALLETEKLRSVISNNSLNKNIKKIIERRLDLLNRFIVSNISGVNMEKCIEELKVFVNNNSEFMTTTRLSFEMTHPKFMSFLRKKGLSEWEISCCCLYCIGLNGNEIANYLDIKYYYKKSSLIRSKLGVQFVNIDTFLVNKMNELH